MANRSTVMTNFGSQNRGFGAIGLILLVGVVAIIAGIGVWVAFDYNHQAIEMNAEGATHSSLNTRPTAAYAGWQTYCSTGGGICFKYPSDWTLAKSADPTGADLATVTNAAQDVQVAYTADVTGLGGHCNVNTCFFDADSLSSLSTGFKVVKGVYTNKGTDTTITGYFVASDDKLQQYKLQVNQNVDVGYFVELFDSPLDSSRSEQLHVKPVPENGFASAADAEAWLAKPDVVTAGKIIGSIYTNR